ncbi:MAG: hypothetical protein FD152_4493, partial [Xanthobacteraceae bacterium]
MIATRSSFWPASAAMATVPSNCALPMTEALATTWKMFSKPRPVIWSEKDMVSSGTPRRSVTSEMAMVSAEAKAPRMAITSFCAMRRWATLAAVVGVEVESAITRLILAPPRALMPPAALISSATSWMPLRELIPNCALAPDNGRMTPILTVRPWPKAGPATSGAVTPPRAASFSAARRDKLDFEKRPEMSSVMSTSLADFCRTAVRRHSSARRMAGCT